jgi:hypothetical protein
MVRSTACALVVAALAPSTAFGHGPCRCLTPAAGPPGTRVHAAYPVYKVIFNPDRTDLTIGPQALWSLHHGGPPITVYRTTWRYSRRPLNEGGSFAVPRVASGRYLVALYDGEEGGDHYSWETFTVRGERSSVQAATKPPPSGSSGVRPGLVAGGIAAALLAGFGAGVLFRSRTRG